MKKMVVISMIIMFIVSAFIFVHKSFAHPGRTNSAGCHRCWTNCEQWGLSYGEYHCH